MSRADAEARYTRLRKEFEELQAEIALQNQQKWVQRRCRISRRIQSWAIPLNLHRR